MVTVGRCDPAAADPAVLTATDMVAGALALLIEEINATPPAMPGDTHPITYHLTPTRHFNSRRTSFAFI